MPSWLADVAINLAVAVVAAAGGYAYRRWSNPVQWILEEVAEGEWRITRRGRRTAVRPVLRPADGGFPTSRKFRLEGSRLDYDDLDRGEYEVWRLAPESPSGKFALVWYEVDGYRTVTFEILEATTVVEIRRRDVRRWRATEPKPEKIYLTQTVIDTVRAATTTTKTPPGTGPQ